MVHALHEAWRVLVPRGIMVDLRPYMVDAPLEIVTKGGTETAGLGDASLNRDHDLAADKAFEFGIHEEKFKELKLEYFQEAYYWNSMKSMVADVESRWKEDVILPEDVLRQAFLLYKKHQAHARVRLWVRMKMVLYGKL
jgi:hypothetical protein